MLDKINKLLSRPNVLAFISSCYMLMITLLFVFATGASLFFDPVGKGIVLVSLGLSLLSFAIWQRVPNRYLVSFHSALAMCLWAYLAYLGAPPVYMLAFIFPFGILWNAKLRYGTGVALFTVAALIKAALVAVTDTISYWQYLYIGFVLLIGLLGVTFDRHLRLAWVKLKNDTEKAQYDKEKAEATLAMAERGFDTMIERFVDQFKEPLAVVMGMNTVLQSYETSRRGMELLNRQFLTGQHLLDLFTQMSANATQKKPHINIQMSPFQMSDVVTVLENQVSALSTPTRKVEVVFDDKIFNHLLGDKLRLLQLLQGLLKIAADRLDDGAISVSISGRLNECEDEVNITFAISAIGDLLEDDTVPQDLSNLQDPFYEKVFNTLGFNLQFCRVLLEELDSTLLVEEGPGSLALSFDLLFRADYDHQSVGDYLNIFQRGSEPDWYNALEGYRVLVVDDSEDTLFVLRELLTLAGVSVDTEDDGNHAILRVLDGAKPYDLIVMDLQMPSMTGADVTKAIRQQYSKNQLPIMGLSVSNRPEEIKASLAAGMNDFMLKPFNIHHFIDFAISNMPRRKKDMPLPEVLDSSLKSSVNDEQESTAQYLSLPDGYDVNAAIANLGGDKQLYLSMLKATLGEWGVYMNQLQGALKRNDIYYAQHVISRFANTALMLGATELDNYLRQLNFSLGLRAMDKEGEQAGLQELARELEEKIWQTSSVLNSVADSLTDS